MYSTVSSSLMYSVHTFAWKLKYDFLVYCHNTGRAWGVCLEEGRGGAMVGVAEVDLCICVWKLQGFLIAEPASRFV